MTGRPTLYTPDLADEVCRRLEDGESLRAICCDEHMPEERTVRRWAVDDREGFSPRYARAREVQAHRWADEIMEIADHAANDTIRTEKGDIPDNEWINRSRLRVDTRKWLLSKLLPKTYGDKLGITGGDGGPVKVNVQVSVSYADDQPGPEAAAPAGATGQD